MPLITGPLGFLLGFGCFDYWLRWAAGMPTIPEDHSQHGAKSWKDYFRFNTDHKVIGIQYICTTFFFFFIGGLMAMLIRAELAQPGTQIVDAATYNSLFSTHAVLMIFVFVIPVFAGIANYVLPLMIGAPDMAFPRLNALSFWMLPLAGLLFIGSFLAPGGAFDAGWTGYAPLSTGAPLGQSFFNLGVQFAGASSIATALNFLVTIITMRAPGMTFWRMPLLVWANLSTSLLVVAATPFIAGVQFMVLFDRALHTSFFQFAGGGDVVSYQHIFWFYSHPAVYIMMLPGFGIISEVISTHARKPIFGYRLMALALIGIVVLSYSVWAHHMFVAGMFSWLRVPMMITTLLIAVPTGIKIFSWLGTLYFGKIHTYSTAMLFALAFIVTFTIGGISGVMLGMVPIDIHVSDTYFIVAHIHFVLFGGSVFTIFAGIYHWFPKMTGRMYDEKLGRVHFWGTLFGTWVTFIPMHWVGMDGMPRRVADYATQFGEWNLLISCGAFILGACPARLPLQHDRQLALRPARRGQPLARQLDRVAGLLAAADLQLRRDPARRRRSLRVRRARRPPRDHGRRKRRDAGGSRSRRWWARHERRPPRRSPCSSSSTRWRAGASCCRRCSERAEKVPFVAVAAPQNQPAVGQLIDSGELRDAARARVEVTMSILSEYGIESVGEVMDPEPSLALDDAVRAHEPGEVLLSCAAGTRFGFTRKDLVAWAEARFEPEVHGHPHPGADLRRLGQLGEEPHAGGGDARPWPRRIWSAGSRSAPPGTRIATRSSARGPRT